MISPEQLDAIYLTRLQVEKWTDEELRLNSNLKSAREELERRQTKGKEAEYDKS